MGSSGTSPVSAVILAAGRSVRFGEPKLVQALKGKPVLQHVIDSALGSKVSETILVLGYRWQQLLDAVNTETAKVVINPDYDEGMSTSLKVGLRTADDKSIGCIVMMGDQPFVSSSLLNRLIDRFLDGDAVAVVSDYKGVWATPVLVSRELFPEVMLLKGDRGARDILKKYGAKIIKVGLRNNRGLLDIDTRGDLVKARKEKIGETRPTIKHHAPRITKTDK
ncbi:MAG: nucleotidyltransferase family protein [Nitrososphaerota archaeon]|nr:nucleotidyltransferase family protein [Nitrososphaerota archaeon]